MVYVRAFISGVGRACTGEVKAQLSKPYYMFWN
jgi:hypothetical protein